MINNISEEHGLYTKKDHMSRFRHFNGKHMYEQKLIDTKSQGEQITNKFRYLPELISDEKEIRNIMKHKTSSK